MIIPRVCFRLGQKCGTAARTITTLLFNPGHYNEALIGISIIQCSYCNRPYQGDGHLRGTFPQSFKTHDFYYCGVRLGA